MNCEEFQLIGLDAGTGRITSAEKAAAADHASVCAKCAALADSWEAARSELSVFAEATRTAQAPARVQMRLLQELRSQKRPHVVYRRAGIIAAWALATAAAIVGVVSWQSWRSRANTPQARASVPAVINSAQESPVSDAVLVADEDGGNFTPLPGALPIDADTGAVYEVRMQRASLGALGLPVNEEDASDWINVDLLVAEDGTPQGVRLHDDANQLASLQ
ncbi:MAG TPA: hypothetical protein VKT53_08515 [Candidatus Acidoferrum sp.]|nr:hypothetical protein [Candidatus Acidoferrum sp.]